MKAQMPPFFCASATQWSASVVLPDDSGPKISTTRPRGSPPMPSAMSRPSEPDGMVATSINLLFLPSRMIEPLPKLRSIWASAASRAFDLSMEEPSTRRSADWAIVPTPYYREFEARQRKLGRAAGPVMGSSVHDLFYVRNMFFLAVGRIYPLGTITKNRVRSRNASRMETMGYLGRRADR